METKICTKCPENGKQPISNFAVNKRDGISGTCKKCLADRARENYKKRKELNKNKKIIITSKKCSCCKKELQASFFGILKKSSDGLRSECKECRHKIFQKSYEPKPNMKQFKKLFDYLLIICTHEKLCKACGLVKGLQHFYSYSPADHKHDFYCKSCWLKRCNSTENKQKKQERRNKRLKADSNFAIHETLRAAIRRGLKRNDANWPRSVTALIKNGLSYTLPELNKHINMQFEYWMNWNNHGIYDPKTWDDNDPSTWTWQLDHIIPQSDLPYDSVDHPNFKKIWLLENLRPLSAKQNIVDGARRVRHNIKGNNV